MKLKTNKSQIIIGLSDGLAENIYHWEGKGDYRLEYLNEEIEGSKGGNSAVFRLISTEDEEDVSVIKFLKYPLRKESKRINDRFQREIEALKEAKESRAKHIIQIITEGVHKQKIGEKNFSYRFYIMEKADEDLGNFIPKSENQLSITEKMALCRDIVKGIVELHDLKIYHRDIKPDNIFLIHEEGKSIWKIGDLGLLSKRGEDLVFEKGKKIGPANWLSPEAMNKFLCEGTERESNFDIEIDDRSDAFQLGCVIWFIFNHNAPIGQLVFDDFLHKDRRVFNVISEMLQHTKKRRRSLIIYSDLLGEIENDYLTNGVKASIKKHSNFFNYIWNNMQKLFSSWTKQ